MLLVLLVLLKYIYIKYLLGSKAIKTSLIDWLKSGSMTELNKINRLKIELVILLRVIHFLGLPVLQSHPTIAPCHGVYQDSLLGYR